MEEAHTFDDVATAFEQWTDGVSRDESVSAVAAESHFAPVGGLLLSVARMLLGSAGRPKLANIAHGPAGCGKTTMLRAAVQQVNGARCATTGRTLLAAHSGMRQVRARSLVQHALRVLRDQGLEVEATPVTVEELCAWLRDNNRCMLLVLDDVEHLYGHAVDDMAPDGEGEAVARCWLRQLALLGSLDGQQQQLCVVLCGSAPCTRRMLFAKMPADCKRAIDQYRHYPKVRRDLGSTNWHLLQFSAPVWHSQAVLEGFLRTCLGEHVHVVPALDPAHAPVDDAGAATGAGEGEAVPQLVVTPLLTHTDGSLRDASEFAWKLYQGQNEVDAVVGCSSFPKKVHFTPALKLLYERILFIAPGTRLLPQKALDAVRNVRLRPLTFQPAAFAMSMSQLTEIAAQGEEQPVEPKHVYDAVDDGFLVELQNNSFGIASLRHLVSFLQIGLDPAEATHMTFTAGTNGQQAEAVVARAVVSWLSSAAPASAFGAGLLRQWWREVVSAAAQLQPPMSFADLWDTSTLKWHSIQHLAMKGSVKRPLQEDRLEAGSFTFAKEHPDEHGSALVAVLPFGPLAHRAALQEADDAADLPTPPAAPEEDVGADAAANQLHVYILRCQVKLCDSERSVLWPGKEGSKTESVRSIVKKLKEGDDGVCQRAAELCSDAFHVPVADIKVHPAHILATTRAVHAKGRQILADNHVLLLDRTALAQHWEPWLREYARRMGLRQYLPT